MMEVLGFVWEWNANPEIWKPSADSFFGLRWYSLMWALSFIIGFYIVKAFFENEKKPLEDLDSLFLTMMLGTILGARIGHCLFYDFHQYFIEDPISILKVWEGGLASHGALIGILIALFIYVKRHSDYKKIFPLHKLVKPRYTYLWILDRMVIPVALAGGFIRTGNFFNSGDIPAPIFVFTAKFNLLTYVLKQPFSQFSNQKEELFHRDMTGLNRMILVD